MTTVGISFKTDAEIKREAEIVLGELGISMSAALNIFLRAVVRENGMPINLHLIQFNQRTRDAIEEGERIAYDETVPAYSSMEELKKALLS
ncbi:MAG: type II toxin-antitoxin system RelB/DinJ family antitoxin [Actinomycetaceae bacterium]|nr:type II toxin-antitoxin system RelB/DinJ family antitoxin [Actinomycetaceae bacterium]